MTDGPLRRFPGLAGGPGRPHGDVTTFLFGAVPAEQRRPGCELPVSPPTEARGVVAPPVTALPEA